jgi:hypothetical protein
MLDLSNVWKDNSDWEPLNTQVSDYSVSPIVDSVPENVIDVPRSSGITFDGVLEGVQKTADTLLNTFGKVYAIDSAIQSAKFQREVTQSKNDVERARALGTLDVQKTAIDANIQIEKSRAARAVDDAKARESSSANAGYIRTASKVSPTIIILGVGAIALLIFMSRKK